MPRAATDALARLLGIHSSIHWRATLPERAENDALGKVVVGLAAPRIIYPKRQFPGLSIPASLAVGERGASAP